MAIFRFIKTLGYSGGYSILKDFCKAYEVGEKQKATMRFETCPGLQAQVDWKERLTLVSKQGEVFTINIFLMILGYSRMKYFCLTLDKSQDSLFQSMIDGFIYFGGVVKEILFDNMKTVVDHSKSNDQQAIINESFYQFSKDMGFQVMTCRPFRPQTKGKVENLSKLMNNICVYNNEFETIEELVEIVQTFNHQINQEVSQATRVTPQDLHDKEKEYLLPLPHLELLEHYLSRPSKRIVSKESMITYKYHKYSLPIKYIGKTVTVKENGQHLEIYLEGILIESHVIISDKKLNYKKQHLIEIMASDAFRDYNPQEIEEIAERNLTLYDGL